MPTAWHIPSDARIWLGGHNIELRAVVEELVRANPRPPTGPIDAGIISPATAEEAAYFAEKLRKRLTPSDTMWIIVTDHTDTTSFEQALAAIGFHFRNSIALSQNAIGLSFALTV